MPIATAGQHVQARAEIAGFDRDGSGDEGGSPTIEAETAAAEAWGAVRARLQAEFGPEIFGSWFERMDFAGIVDGVVLQTVPTRFLRQWIQGHYGDALARAWAAFADVRRVEIAVRSPERPRAAEPAAPTAAVGAAAARPVAAAQPERRAADDPLTGSPLDQRFTFGSFLEGRCNALALAAARQVAEARRGETTAFNPLFLQAPVGFGKTHLLQAVAAEAARSGQRRVLYMTAEHFVYRFVAAIRTRTSVDFKGGLRGIDLFIIDDLQFLQGDRSQEEFCHALNALIDGAGQVVVAADRPPVELDALDARVRSRLGGGLLIEIGPFDAELRLRILSQRVAAQRAAFPGLVVPDDVIEFVARAITTNGRDLDGAVTRLVAHNQLNGAPITVEMAESVLRDLLKARDARRIKIEDIQRIVAQHYGINRTDMLSQRRTKAIVRPRQTAMYLSKMLTPRSLPDIGRRFGGKDHTTVMHAVNRIEQLMGDDPAFADEVEALRRKVEE